MQDGLVKVVAPIEDTPACPAGMQSGDLIVQADGEPIKGLSLAQAVWRRCGRPRGHRFAGRRKACGFHDPIVRAIIKVRAVRWQTWEASRISAWSVFRMARSGNFKAFTDIREDLGRAPTGVISTSGITWWPFGSVDCAGGPFLDEGEIVTVRGRT